MIRVLSGGENHQLRQLPHVLKLLEGPDSLKYLLDLFLAHVLQGHLSKLGLQLPVGQRIVTQAVGGDPPGRPRAHRTADWVTPTT